MDDSLIKTELSNFILQKNFPCVSAIQALSHNEILYDCYQTFGSGSESYKLLCNLINFKSQLLNQKQEYLTYMAIYPLEQGMSEEEFETKLWRELSAIWNHSELAGKWDSRFSDDPNSKSFCFSIDGEAFFAVGLHPNSSRISRRFSRVAIAFNLYTQFTDLMDKGKYEALVKTIRNRDMKLQGNINPMVEKYGDTYEPIQFSGKFNTPDWKCPFSKGLSTENESPLEEPANAI